MELKHVDRNVYVFCLLHVDSTVAQIKKQYFISIYYYLITILCLLLGMTL